MTQRILEYLQGSSHPSGLPSCQQLISAEDLQILVFLQSLPTPLEGWELSAYQDLPSGPSQRQMALTESRGNISESPLGEVYKNP